MDYGGGKNRSNLKVYPGNGFLPIVVADMWLMMPHVADINIRLRENNTKKTTQSMPHNCVSLGYTHMAGGGNAKKGTWSSSFPPKRSRPTG